MLWAKMMKHSSYVKQFYMDISNKSSWFSSNNLGDTTLQSLRCEKTQKISLVPIPRYENIADLFLIIPGQIQMSSKRFHLYSFIKLSKMRLWGPFKSFFLNGCHGNYDRCENFNSNFWWVFSSCLRVQSLITVR